MGYKSISGPGCRSIFKNRVKAAQKPTVQLRADKRIKNDTVAQVMSRANRSRSMILHLSVKTKRLFDVKKATRLRVAFYACLQGFSNSRYLERNLTVSGMLKLQ